MENEENKTITLKLLAKDYHNPEKDKARKILFSKNIYIDIAGIEWEKDKLKNMNKEKIKYLFGYEIFNK